jgi:fatty acid-binding protein DegV
MNPYVIFTDTACDIPVDLLNAWGVKYASLTFRFTDEDREYAENDIPSHDFYERMRAGGIAKTSAINTETFRKTFEAELKEGHDILYIGFSSGLSTTYNSGRVAAQELAEKYPERSMKRRQKSLHRNIDKLNKRCDNENECKRMNIS